MDTELFTKSIIYIRDTKLTKMKYLLTLSLITILFIPKTSSQSIKTTEIQVEANTENTIVTGGLDVSENFTANVINTKSASAWFYGWNFERSILTMTDGELGLLIVNEKNSNNSNYSLAAVLMKSHYGISWINLGSGGSGLVGLKYSEDDVLLVNSNGSYVELFWTYLRMH